MSTNKKEKQNCVDENNFPVDIKIIPKGTMSIPKIIQIDVNERFLQLFEEVLA